MRRAEADGMAGLPTTAPGCAETEDIDHRANETNSAAFAAEFVCILIVVSRLHIHGLHQSQIPSELR